MGNFREKSVFATYYENPSEKVVKKGCWLPVGKNTQNAAAGEVLALVNTDSYHSNIGFQQAYPKKKPFRGHQQSFFLSPFRFLGF